jgi:hypothetical protein
MAAGKFFIYTSALKYFANGTINLDSDAIQAVPLHSGYTPGTASHSAYSQISNFIATASATVVNSITLSDSRVTGSGAVSVKFDSDDISGFSAGGDTFQCKYVALVHNTATAAAQLIGWFDTDTAASTGVEGTQVNVTVPAGGWFKFNGNS